MQAQPTTKAVPHPPPGNRYGQAPSSPPVGVGEEQVKGCKEQGKVENIRQGQGRGKSACTGPKSSSQ